jgi:WD40 repeat protein
MLALTVTDRNTTVWDLTTGRAIKRLSGFEHGQGVVSCGFSANGRWALAGMNDIQAITTITWDTASGTVTSRLTAALLAVSDESFLTSQADGSVTLRTFPNGNSVRTFASQLSKGGTISASAISPQNRLVAIAGDDHILRIWNTKTGQVIFTLSFPDENITSVSIASNESSIMVGGGRNSITEWSIEDRRLLGKLQYLPKGAGEEDDSGSVAFSADHHWATTPGDDPKRKTSAVGNVSSAEGRRLATPQSPDGPGAVLWDLGSWKRART